MGETYAEIPDYLIEWIKKQHMFWVASAPLSASGHVNVSPKGVAGTFHVESPTQVWYEDLSGSGAETIAHIRENGRVTILFNAFDGPPRIARLYGTGSFYELGSPEYGALLPPGTRQPGSRAVIVVDIYEVGTTCGYSVPYYSFVGHRTPLLDWAARKEALDLSSSKTSPRPPHSESTSPACSPATKLGEALDAPTVEPHPNGLLTWWKVRNTLSLDGLPALDLAFRQPASTLGDHIPVRKARQPALNRYPSSKQPVNEDPLTTSDVRIRSLWSWVIMLAQCVRWLLQIQLLSVAITFLDPRLLLKKGSEGSSMKGALAPTTGTREGPSINVPTTVLIHGEETQEALQEAGEVERPPVSWGVKNHNNAKGNHITGTRRPANTGSPTISSWTTSPSAWRIAPTVVPLGYGVSFLLGMIFMTTFAEVYTAGRHAAALVLDISRQPQSV